MKYSEKTKKIQIEEEEEEDQEEGEIGQLQMKLAALQTPSVEQAELTEEEKKLEEHEDKARKAKLIDDAAAYEASYIYIYVCSYVDP